MPVSNPWVAIDLDGTLMEDGHYPEFGPPIKGAKLACMTLKHFGIKIMVFTARTAITGLDGSFQDVNESVRGIYAWAAKYGIPIDYVFPMPKPTFVLAFIDDRAVEFNGSWLDAIDAIERKVGPLNNISKEWIGKVLPPAKEV